MEPENQPQAAVAASKSGQVARQPRSAAPLQFFITISIGIFIAEVIAMVVVYYLKPLPYYQTVLLDAGVMLTLISPFLYFFSFRPLVQHIEMRRQAEADLQHAYEQLELRVQERTQELSIANSELEREILERRKAEQAIKESEERYRSLFSNINEGFALHEIILDVEGNPCDYRFLELNHAFERLTGIAEEKALGRTVKEVLPNIEPSWIATYGRVALTGEPVLYENYSADLGKWYETYCYCPRKGQFAVLFFDITERKQTEEKLLYQAAILSSLNDAIVASDAQYRLTAWNSAAESLYGWKAEDVIGRNGLEIMRTEWFEVDADEMRRTIAATGRWRGEATQQRMDGTRFPVEVSSMVLHDDHGRITGYVSVNRDITARKQAEEALRKNEATLRGILDATKESIWLFSAEGNILLANETALLRIRNPAGNIIGEPISKFIPGEIVQQRQKRLTEVIESGHSVEFEDERAGMIFHHNFYPIQDGHGNVTQIVTFSRDITERKKAEEALRESEKRLNRAQEIAHLGSWELDLLNDKLTWSDEVYRIFGLQPQEFGATYEAFLRFIHPEDKQAVDAEYSLSIQEGRDRYEIEHRIVKQTTGEVRVVLERCEHIRNESGQIVRSLGMVHDITERRQTEEALRQARDELEVRVQQRTEELAAANRDLSNEIVERREVERQLRIQTAAMDAAANGIIITDPKGCILWGNPAMAEISGYEDGELLGRSTHIFSSGRHGPDYYRQMWGTILAGKVWHGETTNRRKNGDLYVEEQTITPVQDDKGQISHFIAIKQDVTERNLIYSQLEASNRELTALTVSERQQRFLAEGLIESSMALNMSLELDAVLDHIFEQTRRAIPYLTADIVLIDAGVATFVRQWGSEGFSATRSIFENDSLTLQEFPIWERICATKSVVMIPDTGLEHQWNTYFGMNWVRSYLGAPLIYNDQVIGIINLISDQANAFHQEMAKNLRAFAAPAAVAIQNARLYENEQRNRKIAEILSAASVALSQTLDIQMVMETILDYVQFVLPCEIAFVILSEGEERYRIRAARSGDENIVSPDQFLDQTIDLLNEPVVRSYFARSESTLLPDSREVPEWHPPLELASMNCWLGIPLESMGKILGIVMVAHTTPNIFTKDQIKLVEAVVKQAVVALQNAWLFEQVRAGRERLQQLSRHLVEIQENERKYIARELHDETSQSLTSLKLGLQVIEQNADPQAQVMDQVTKLKSLADETLESLHHLAVNLRPASLDHLGLVDALTGLIESTRQRSGLIAHFKIMGTQQEALLTEEIETSIFRIVQESLTNVIRHAHAAHVDIILDWQDDKIVVIIEDDGVGMNMQRTNETGRLGLIGMRERAEMLGGKLLLDSTPQVGTTLVVEIPYANSNTYSR